MARPFGKNAKKKKPKRLVVPRVPYASLERTSRTARRARTSLRTLAADIADSSKEAKEDAVAELVQDAFGDILKKEGKKEKKRNARAVEVLQAQADFCREAESMISCHCREDRCPWKQQKADAMRTREFVLRSLAPRFERHDLTDTTTRRARSEQQGAGSVQREGGPAGRKRFLNVGTLSKNKFTRLRKGATEAGGDVLLAALGGLRNSGPYAREKPRGRPSWARREAGMAAKIRKEWLNHCRTSSGKRRGGKSVLVLTGLLTQVIEEIRAEVNKDRAPGVRPVSRYAVQINRPAGIRTWRRKTDMCHICINGPREKGKAKSAMLMHFELFRTRISVFQKLCDPGHRERVLLFPFLFSLL